MGLFDVFKKKKKPYVRNRQMEVLLCFLKDTFTGGDVLDLMKQAGITPSAVSRERDFVQITAEVYDDIKNADAATNEEWLTRGLTFMEGNNNYKVSIQNAGNVEKCQELCWRPDSMQFLESPFFKKLITHDRFIVAYCYNQEDHLFQNMTDLYYLGERGIKPVATRTNRYGQLEADLDKNPGRQWLSDQTWLISAWRMWFGKNFYSIVNKEKIRAFDKAFSIKEIENGITSVQLYENHEDFDSENSRQIQMSFREWMEFLKLATTDK